MPAGLEGLRDLALDVRWNWTFGHDRLWEILDPETFERTNNPQLILESIPQHRLEKAARDPELLQELQQLLHEREAYLKEPGWFGRTYPAQPLKAIAYFSMEFGLTEALPIYSGGLGILAGDYLKAASDLGVPVFGIGLLYQQGYFRQIMSADHRQLEAFPFNDPTDLPVTPVQDRDGAWLRIRLELPGRTLLLRVWQAQVGKVRLYLLDSNDPLNSPWDRTITATLYPPEQERRFLQEVAVGVGGWLMLEALGIDVDVCHLNEGHVAFATLARARRFMVSAHCPLDVALCATRAGNVFTTHTPSGAAFHRFDPALIEHFARPVVDMLGTSMQSLLGLGRNDPDDPDEPFNMTYLALRTSGSVNGVSQLHGNVSRRIFEPLYPDWPRCEIPVAHITNGIHVPSWDSEPADKLWRQACGEDRWYGMANGMSQSMARVSDTDLWNFRAASRYALVDYVRKRLVRQVREHGAAPDTIHRAANVLDPNVLTLGFARRFTEYKRPTLLLHDPARLQQILMDTSRPVQLVFAGKAHPADEEGKWLLHCVAEFAAIPELFDRVVFLEDYNIALAKHFLAGVDVWLNTPRRPCEASGTSGMKALVNGGINLSELDGWWAEAYTPEVGWALGDGQEHAGPEWDEIEADQLYRLLESEIVPEFYSRDVAGIPQAWVQRIRTSMSRLTPQYSCNRMLRDYVEQAYLPAVAAYRRRTANQGQLAAALRDWQAALALHWRTIHFGEVRVSAGDGVWQFDVQVYFAELNPDAVRVELYADPLQPEGLPTRITLVRDGVIPGALNSYRYSAAAPADRPAEHYTPRIVPFHSELQIPLEERHVRWRR